MKLDSLSKLIPILWLAQIFIILFSWRQLPPQLPLFYSRPWGEEQLVTPLGMLILPAFSLLVLLGNLFVSSFIPKEEALIKQILIVTVFVFNLFCLITLIQIIRLVI